MPLVAGLDLDSLAQALVEDTIVPDLRESGIPTELTWDTPDAFHFTVPGVQPTFQSAFYMKPRLLAHGKRTKPRMVGRGAERHMEFGYRYQIIPFGWRTTGGGSRTHGPLGAGGVQTTAGTKRTKYIGPDDLDEESRQFLARYGLTAVQYGWANTAGENMVTFEDRRKADEQGNRRPYYFPGTGRNLMPHQGITFRTVSEKSNPSAWWYPAHHKLRITAAAKATLRWLGVW